MVAITTAAVQLNAGTASRLQVTNTGAREVYLAPTGGRVLPGRTVTVDCLRGVPTVGSTAVGSSSVDVVVTATFPSVPPSTQPPPDPGSGGGTNVTVDSDGTLVAGATTVELATDAQLAALSGSYGRKPAPTAKTTTYTAVVGDLVLADATSAGFTVTLPASPTTGDVVWVKKVDTSANVVTVVAAGKTIDGDANATIVSEDAGGEFVYDGTNWRVAAVASTIVGGVGTSVTSVVGQTGAVTGTQIVADATVAAALAAKAPVRSTLNAQTGTTYTLVLGDENKLVTLTNASAVTVTIPTNASVAFPVGSRVDCVGLGAGLVTFSGAGVTIRATPSATTRAQYSAVSLTKIATDEWLVVGDLA